MLDFFDVDHAIGQAQRGARLVGRERIVGTHGDPGFECAQRFGLARFRHFVFDARASVFERDGDPVQHAGLRLDIVARRLEAPEVDAARMHLQLEAGDLRRAEVQAALQPEAGVDGRLDDDRRGKGLVRVHQHLEMAAQAIAGDGFRSTCPEHLKEAVLAVQRPGRAGEAGCGHEGRIEAVSSAQRGHQCRGHGAVRGPRAAGLRHGQGQCGSHRRLVQSQQLADGGSGADAPGKPGHVPARMRAAPHDGQAHAALQLHAEQDGVDGLAAGDLARGGGGKHGGGRRARGVRQRAQVRVVEGLRLAAHAVDERSIGHAQALAAGEKQCRSLRSQRMRALDRGSDGVGVGAAENAAHPVDQRAPALVLHGLGQCIECRFDRECGQLAQQRFFHPLPLATWPRAGLENPCCILHPARDIGLCAGGRCAGSIGLCAGKRCAPSTRDNAVTT